MTAALSNPSGQFQRPPLRVRWGPDSLGSIGEALARSAAERVLIVTGASLGGRHDLLGLLDDATGGRIIGTFAGVRRHSPIDSVLAAATAIADHRADALIAVGGGSAMVTARAANIVLAEGRPIRELATRYESGRFASPRLDTPKLAMYAVPTTPTTATSKAGSAVTVPGHRRRLALFDPKTRAHTIAVHPEFLATAPDGLVLNASLNALCMSFEGLISVHANDWSDAALGHAARRLLELLDPQNRRRAGFGRTELVIAAIMAGDGSDTARGGLGAALSHTIGHRHAVPNGVVEAILLPHVLNRVAASHPGRRTAAMALGVANAEQVPKTLAALLCRLGTPGRLREVGLDEESLVDVASEAMSDFSVTAAPGQPDSAALLALLRAAW